MGQQETLSRGKMGVRSYLLAEMVEADPASRGCHLGTSSAPNRAPWSRSSSTLARLLFIGCWRIASGCLIPIHGGRRAKNYE
jgi:hypothetical protein